MKQGPTSEEDQQKLSKLRSELKQIDDTIKNLELNSAQMQFLALANAVNQFATEVSKLGSGGVLAATMAEFTLSFVDNINTLKNSTAEGLEATTEKLAITANVLGNLSKVVGAARDNKIAGIDREIEAEKRRDGQSQASQAKILAMEKKKEAAGRKTFKIQKAIALAQTLISTSAAMMTALAPPPLGLGPLAGAGLAKVIAAMGAVQMAVIASQKYGGFTASKPEAGGTSPTSLSLGKRSNAVDVSKRASGSEIAFLRGDRGVGTTANNFQPMGGASGLRKGYAEGGVVVGERGPEMIQPTSGFNVVPNDQLGGRPVVANFTVNAIDAQGVEAVLQEQQGNIINMIRSAANEYGEEFIESVNTDHLGRATSGGNY